MFGFICNTVGSCRNIGIPSLALDGPESTLYAMDVRRTSADVHWIDFPITLVFWNIKQTLSQKKK